MEILKTRSKSQRKSSKVFNKSMELNENQSQLFEIIGFSRKYYFREEIQQMEIDRNPWQFLITNGNPGTDNNDGNDKSIGQIAVRQIAKVGPGHKPSA